MEGIRIKIPVHTRRSQQTGMVSAVEMVLTIPFFAAAVLIIVQIAMIAHATLVVRYAAYSAARSARVHLVDSDHAFRELDCCDAITVAAAKAFALGGVNAVVTNMAGQDLGNWRNKAQKAAMNTLVSISPGNKDVASKASPDSSLWDQQFMTRYYDAVTTTNYNNSYQPRAQILLNKSRYAYDTNNSTITIETFSPSEITNSFSSPQAALGQANRVGDLYSFGKYVSQNSNLLTNVPVRATVEFRFPLQIPFAAPIFCNDRNTPRVVPVGKKPWVVGKGACKRPYVRLITRTVDLT